MAAAVRCRRVACNHIGSNASWRWYWSCHNFVVAPGWLAPLFPLLTVSRFAPLNSLDALAEAVNQQASKTATENAKLIVEVRWPCLVSSGLLRTEVTLKWLARGNKPAGDHCRRRQNVPTPSQPARLRGTLPLLLP